MIINIYFCKLKFDYNNGWEIFTGALNFEFSRTILMQHISLVFICMNELDYGLEEVESQ